ncbi:MAG: RSP_7527 family protein [Kiloniellales bacterium]
MSSLDERRESAALDSATIDFYLARGRQLQAEAIASYGAGLLRALAGLPRRLVALVESVPHSRLWRTPGSGNCLNC